MPRCSIIIPVCNLAPLTKRCLDTIFALQSGGIDFEVIVVDDASVDETPRLLAAYSDKVRIVTHSVNAGFSIASNHGADVASGEYLLFLNNDTRPTAGWLDALVDYADNHLAAAAVGSKLVFPDGTIQHAGVVIGQDRNPRHLYLGFPADHPAVNKSRRFQVVTGACVLIRSRCFREVGGFDAAFRNGYEDVDLCLRLGERGHEIHYCHRSAVHHLGSASRGSRSRDVRMSFQLYRKRWADRVRPDDLQYYVDDSLLTVSYDHYYPLRLKISALLATLEWDHRQLQAERLVNVRSRQVFDLLKETVRLTAEIGELMPEHDLGREDEHDLPPGALAQDTAGHASPDTELRELLADAQRQLLLRDDRLESMIYGLQLQLAALQRRSSAMSADRTFRPSDHLKYRELVRRIRALVNSTVPPGATIIVVSEGDDELLRLEGRTAWHFPQQEDGSHAGYHPADSEDAIASLEALRTRGGEFLLVPSTASWWLDHYLGFKEYLDRRFARVVDREGTCVIFALGDVAMKGPTAGESAVSSHPAQLMETPPANVVSRRESR